MQKYQLDSTNNKKFTFEFSTEDTSKECEIYGSRYISFKLMRNDKLREIFNWEGCLSIEQLTPFELSFPDRIDIRGEMRLYKHNQNEDYIWINVYYGYNSENHFEGNIILLSKNSGDIEPPLPPIDPLPPEESL